MKRLLFNQLDEKGNTVRELSAIGGSDAIIKIGTHAQCKIRLEDSFVMSLHATVEPLESAALLRFCGGDPERCGLNGKTARNDYTYPIQIGDRILVGKTVLQLVGIGEAEDDRGLDDLSEVLERIATFLGFKTDGSPSGTAKAFAHWLAFAEAFVASPDGQHQATWTEVMMRAIGTRGMMAARSEASEAADVADAALRELVKRFPPRMQDVIKVVDASWPPSDGERSDLLADHVHAASERDNLDVALEEIAKWRGVTGCETPEEASGIIASREETLERRQRDAAEAKTALVEMQKDRDLWRSNFRDAERLILSIREALGIPKEGYADVLAVAKSAIVPKPKPEKIEVGQRWARVDQIVYMWENGDVSIGRIGTFSPRVFECSTMVYLGKA